MAKSILNQTYLAVLVVLAVLMGLQLQSTEARAEGPQLTPGNMANPTEAVRGLVLKNISQFQAQYVTVFYAIATKPFVSVNARQIKVSEIHAVATRQVNGPFVSFPPVQLEVDGFRPGYNYVAIVFHAGPNFVWLNGDGTLPTDPRGLNPRVAETVPTLVMTYSKPQLESLAIRQGQPASVVIEL